MGYGNLNVLQELRNGRGRSFPPVINGGKRDASAEGKGTDQHWGKEHVDRREENASTEGKGMRRLGRKEFIVRRAMNKSTEGKESCRRRVKERND